MAKSNENDWKEEVYQKIKTMKEKYFLELNEVYVKFIAKLEEEEHLPEKQRKISKNVRLKLVMEKFEQMIKLLCTPKSNIEPVLMNNMDAYEKTIIDLVTRYKLLFGVGERGQSSPGMEMIGNEQVYQRIKSMKEKYFLELNEIYEKCTATLEKETHLPEQQRRVNKNVRLKPMMEKLERMIKFLCVSKNSIQAISKDNLDECEKTIADLLNFHKQFKVRERGQSSEKMKKKCIY